MIPEPELPLRRPPCARATAVRSRLRASPLRALRAGDAASMPSRPSPRKRALADAAAVDAKFAAGDDPGPLAGVPFAVKNLYDVAGIATVAGSRIDRNRTPASRDAALVRRLAGQGAVLVGALNMDEYAYGFSTENSHYGATRNPHDAALIAGGSSGGSAAAVAASLLPLTLGSDTNGSIRVPAALCGVFGLRPTLGRLSRAGMRLFASSLDVGGPFAVRLKTWRQSMMLSRDRTRTIPACAPRPAEPVAPMLRQGIGGVCIGVAAGHFASQGIPEVFAAVDRVAEALSASQRIEVPAAGLARAAAMIVTAVEGAELHLPKLIAQAADFDQKTRARFLAGALVPGAWYAHAQRFRRWYCRKLAALFRDVDVLLTPATPYPAFPVGQEFMELGSQKVRRPDISAYSPSLFHLPACRHCPRRSFKPGRYRSVSRSSPHPGGRISYSA